MQASHRASGATEKPCPAAPAASGPAPAATRSAAGSPLAAVTGPAGVSIRTTLGCCVAGAGRLTAASADVVAWASWSDFAAEPEELPK